MERLRALSIALRMSSQRDMMDKALERLKVLANQLPDGPVRKGIEALIADLEAEKVASDEESGKD